MAHMASPQRNLKPSRRQRRGMFLLPSVITVGNMFCGYACVMYAMRGDLAFAAPFIGIAFLLDGMDGRIARMTGTSSEFGLQLDSLADIISFGMAPAILAFAWGLSDLGRWGWAIGFLYVTAAAMRLARFNVQTTTQTDKRYFIGLASPAAAGVIASTVFAFPRELTGYAQQVAAIAVVVVPALLMVSTIRFRSFKTLNLGYQKSRLPLLIFVVFIVLVATEPQYTLLILAYSYLLSAFIGQIVSRVRGRRGLPPPAAT
jgi:CDP-diacylglycerol--serine O-phosphatidyltransferase